jgi:hypothetical protein
MLGTSLLPNTLRAALPVKATCTAAAAVQIAAVLQTSATSPSKEARSRGTNRYRLAVRLARRSSRRGRSQPTIGVPVGMEWRSEAA